MSPIPLQTLTQKMKQILTPIIILCLLTINGFGFDKKIRELQKQGEYGKAICLIYDQLKSTSQKKEIVLLHKLASETWFRLDDFEKSLESINKAIVTAKPLKNDTLLAKLYNNKGIVYTIIEKWDSCAYYYEISLNLKKKIKDKKGVYSSYNNLGMVHKNLGNFSKAIEMYSKSLEIAKEHSLIKKEYKILNNIANVYKELQPDSSLHYYKKALVLAKNEHDLNEQRKIVNNLTHQLESIQNYKEALNYLYEFSRLNDTIFNIEQEKRIADFQLQQEIDRKQHTIELQKTKLENRKELIIISSLAAILLLITLLFVFYYYYQNQKSKDELIALKQESLKNYLVGQEREKQNVAKQLHDDLNGSLAGARFTNTKNKREFFVRQAQGQLDDAVEGLFSDALDKAGLKMALLQYEELMRNEKIEINFSHSPNLPRFEWWAEIGVYRLSVNLVKTAKENGITDMHLGLYYEDDIHELEISLITEGKKLVDSSLDSQVRALIVALEGKLIIKDEVVNIYTQLKPLKTTKNEMADS